jgi:predicted CoA-binding protein
MPHDNPPDDQIRELLAGARRIAVVGASSNPERPSYGIFGQLLRAGYDVIPVNPNETSVHGQAAYASLREVPGPIDIVNVFRRSEHTPAVAGEAVAIAARALWLQSGIRSESAAELATAGGLVVIMDACIGVMHSLLRVPRR